MSAMSQPAGLLCKIPNKLLNIEAELMEENPKHSTKTDLFALPAVKVIY